ncbi:MAG TPA: hypothetical protein VFQ60_01685 [Patescibacteria group bacterium]|nr:hypothetical protein [Patescibacteria group bacterium]
MKKFFVLFCIPKTTMDEWMAAVDEPTRKKQSEDMMRSWQTWTKKNEKSILDYGLPVGKTKRITSKGATDARNDINWYLVIEAESSESAVKILKEHPHLQIPGAYIDVSDASMMGNDK